MLIDGVVERPLSAELKQGLTKTPLKGHALIGYAAALLSLRENRTVAPPGLPGANKENPGLFIQAGIFFIISELNPNS